MHEMSIALNIFELVIENARNEKAKKVLEVELDVGNVSGVEHSALEFALKTAHEYEMLENAKFVVNKIPAIARCLSCNEEFEIKNAFDPCPKCTIMDTQLISGKELRIKSLLID